jgi:transposase
MIIIGVDPHKRMHVASVVEPATNRQVAALQIEASLAGYRRLLKWAGAFSERRWAVENTQCLGRHLAQWLLARGGVVEDVPSTATARVRELSRGGRRKNDVIDAAAAASVAALQGEAHLVLAEDITTVLALLDERRTNVTTQRTRLVNQLHAVFRDLLPGGAPTHLTATIGSRLLAGIRPAGPVEAARKQLGREPGRRDSPGRPAAEGSHRSDSRDGRRDRQPVDRGRRCWAGPCRPAAGPHPAGEPIPNRSGLR